MRSSFMSILASVLAATRRLRPESLKRVTPARVRVSRNGMPHQGKAEIARRRRQIERMRFGWSNGLLSLGVDGTRWTSDSHGVCRPFYS